MNRPLLYFLLFTAILHFACEREDNFITDGSARLEFSVDTLRFDTVFTELGSATRFFKVYNPNDRPVRISSVYLEQRENSMFRLNVDGTPGGEVKDVEVLGNDSVYVFAEVTVDPDQPRSVSPFVVEERVVFITNDNQQAVNLEAWGQNANYFPNRFNRGKPVLLTCNFGEISWDDPKPYVIYGEVFVDSCTLNIPAGAQIYVHGGIARNEVFGGTFNDGILYTLEGGKLKIKGTQEEPVIIQGDRLEESFLDEEGQWAGIILGKGSTGNEFNYTTVRNSIFGVYVDSNATLEARNSRIYNTAGSGIVGFHSRITAENCLIYNNFAPAVQLIQGGDYQFTYCTLASYGLNTSALSMSNFFCYDDPTLCQQLETYRLNARFNNSIIFGSSRDEIQLSDITGRGQDFAFNLRFNHCLVRVEELLEERDSLYGDFFETYCVDCINGTLRDPLFRNVDEDDYRLDSLSIARGRGVPLFSVQTDIEGNARDPENPDLGSFEFRD